MFYWMNRRLYYFLLVWIRAVLSIIGAMAILIGLIYLYIYMLSVWGVKGTLAFWLGVVLVFGSAVYALVESADLYQKELDRQRNTERALKRDWPSY